MKTRDKNYAEINDYLSDEKKKLSFDIYDIKVIKNKINQIYKINKLATLNEQINELKRIKAELEWDIESSEKFYEFFINAFIYVVLLGSIIGTLDKVIEMLLKINENDYFGAISTTLTITFLIAFVLFLGITGTTLRPENRLKKNRIIAVFVLDQMIQEKNKLNIS